MIKIPKDIQFIVMDIEGTTTSVSFVYEVLFPYFRENALTWKDDSSTEFKELLKQTQALLIKESGRLDYDPIELIQTLIQWSIEDRKIAPLKEFQGMVWDKAYRTGKIKGHVFPDVKPSLERWQKSGLNLAVFSSGSIHAQRLLFEFSETGNLLPFFTTNFDTNTGSKREELTYQKIAANLNVSTSSILFLSDIVEELEAADKTGMKTIQIVRKGTIPSWSLTAKDFFEIQ